MSDLHVHWLWWLLSLHVVLEWGPSYLEQECSLESCIFKTLMPRSIIHDEQKLNSARGRGSAELCTQPDSCGWGVDGSLGWQCSSWTASSSLPPRLPATFQWASPPCWLWKWGETALCLSPGCYSPADCSPAKDAHASAPTLPGCLTDSLFVLFSFPPPCINLVGFNLIASFSDRLSQEQCKWALKCGDLVYICQLIAWVAQTSRAGTWLLMLRSLISDLMLHVEAELLIEEDVLFGQHLALGESDLNSLDWVCFMLQTLITEAVAQCKAAWICSLRGELTQASPVKPQPSFPSACPCYVTIYICSARAWTGSSMACDSGVLMGMNRAGGGAAPSLVNYLTAHWCWKKWDILFFFDIFI